MPRYFVNLPLRYIAREPEYLAAFIARGLQPELGMDAMALDAQSLSWHREVAAALAGAGLLCSVHLPFMDLHPGGLDQRILAATRERLLQALDVARIYAPQFMISHAWYFDAFYRSFFETWVQTSAETWETLLRAWPGHPPLYLENVFETGPAPLRILLETLAGRGLAGIGWCLDVGHWHSFGSGARRDNLVQWLDALAPFLGHLHLHDNSGADDEHLGLGQGRIPWPELFSSLKARGLSPGMTLEPHTAEDLEHTLRFMAEHPEWFPRG